MDSVAHIYMTAVVGPTDRAGTRRRRPEPDIFVRFLHFLKEQVILDITGTVLQPFKRKTRKTRQNWHGDNLVQAKRGNQSC